MNGFKLRPEIFLCPSVEAFRNEFAIGKDDVVLTDRIFASLELGCDKIYEDDYGFGEPTDEKLNAILSALEKKPYKRIVAVGGGTVIDIAKLLVDSGKRTCEELYNGTIRKDRELIAVPTTCGTGSEVTNISIVNFVVKKTKIGRVDEALYPDKAVLIPKLLKNLPYSVFISSSIDALIHAVEAFLSPKHTPLSRKFSVDAIQMILSGYLKTEPGVPPADYTAYLMASLYAGIAFSNAGCGLVHAMSYPIGGTYHLPHGAANAKVFMNVMDFYDRSSDMTELYDVMAATLGSENVPGHLKKLINRLMVNTNLSALGMDEAVCAAFAQSVMQTQKRLLANAYVTVSEEQIKQIYLNMLENEK